MMNIDAGRLRDIADGEARLSDDEAVRLFDYPLHMLGRAAHIARNRLNDPTEATYLVDRNINYTNICDIRCEFCAFSRNRDDDDAYSLGASDLFEKVGETVEAGGSGVLLQGGCNSGLGIEHIQGILDFIKLNFPSLRIHALSPPEIVFMAENEGISVDDALKRLMDSGLDSLPGGGAEILVDEIRNRISPGKCSSDEWLNVMRVAHGMGLKTTATMMFGHVESYDDRIEHMRRIRELQDDTGGFVAFIPWTFQPGGNVLGKLIPATSGIDYLKTLAISRLYLWNIPHIGASWLTQGTKLGQVGLHFGADDIGSVMLEENVVAAAGCLNRTNETELRSIISGAGFVPRKRDAIYNYVDNT